MTEGKDAAKAAKKAAKAEAKKAKKEAKAAATAGTEPTAPPSGLSPAERAAAAAERQVKLQRWRVFFALLMFLVAVATFLAAYRPWQNGADAGENAPPGTASPSGP